MSTTEATATSTSSGKGRTVGAWICFALATLLFLLSAVAYWGARTLNDTSRYVDTVGPLVHSPEVQQAIITRASAAIEQQVNVEATINEVFGSLITDKPRLKLLVGPLAGAINGLIEREVTNVVQSDAFADLWVRANTRVQQQLVQLLQGQDGGAVRLEGDNVVLDVSDVIDAVKQRLVARGLTVVENVPIPQTDKQIVLLEAPQLAQARTIYAFANPVASWLIWVVAALYLGAFLLSRRRPRMTVAIGIALAANALLLAWGLAVSQQLFVNQLAGTVWGPASNVFWDTLLSFLIRGWHTFFWLGVVFVVAGWFAGRNASGTATRQFVRGSLEAGGAALSGPLGGVGRWVAAGAGWLRWIAVALGWVVLLWGTDVSPEKLLWSVVLVVVLLLAIQFLVGAGGNGPGVPKAEDADATEPPESAVPVAAGGAGGAASSDTAVVDPPSDSP